MTTFTRLVRVLLALNGIIASPAFAQEAPDGIYSGGISVEIYLWPQVQSGNVHPEGRDEDRHRHRAGTSQSSA